MKRKALLIGAPEDGESPSLDGVIVDVDRFHQYLRTPLGGAWRDDEALTVEFLTETAAFLDPVWSRQKFDAWLSKCASACVVLKACSVDEYAYDGGAEGGLYSSALIKMAQVFEGYMETREERRSIVVDVAFMHRLARKEVQRLKGYKQNPDIEMPRSMKPIFPFAVFTR